jgi:site-specific DNA-cytosine methylase
LEGIDMDLLADETWARWKAKVEVGEYIAIIMGPPCRTFSRARGPTGTSSVARL